MHTMHKARPPGSSKRRPEPYGLKEAPTWKNASSRNIPQTPVDVNYAAPGQSVIPLGPV